jgi:hypothetical protein
MAQYPSTVKVTNQITNEIPKHNRKHTYRGIVNIGSPHSRIENQKDVSEIVAWYEKQANYIW